MLTNVNAKAIRIELGLYSDVKIDEIYIVLRHLTVAKWGLLSLICGNRYRRLAGNEMPLTDAVCSVQGCQASRFYFKLYKLFS